MRAPKETPPAGQHGGDSTRSVNSSYYSKVAEASKDELLLCIGDSAAREVQRREAA